MAIEVELISKELIKPSSPTPNHLLKHKFSFIDQNQFPISLPILLFYEKCNKISNQQRCNLLKQSLSKALTIYYPLASRINNYSYAECNDKGTLFIEAKANCKLANILESRNQYYKNSKKFIPSQPHKGVNQYGSLFQVTYFTCGGLAVCFTMAHMLGDALSQFMFLRDWVAIARGQKIESPPFVSDSVFPTMKVPGFDLTEVVFKKNVVTKPFTFDASVISSLRDTYSANGEKLSRVLALSIFILSRIVAATSKPKNLAGENNRCMVINSVNVRPVLDPPISNHSFGNLVWAAPALIDDMDRIGEGDRECYYEIARRIKDSISSVNGESLRKLRNGELNFAKETVMEAFNGEVPRYMLSSLCNFPVYGADFGWGNPEWIATSVPIENFIFLVDRKEGQGIEAWISMTEEDMARFENDHHLLRNLSNQNRNFSSRL